MINLVLNLLHKSKAVNIKLFKQKKDCILADYIIIVTGTSNKHITHMFRNIIKTLKTKNINYNITLEKKYTDWIILDLEKIIVHIMSIHTRKIYNLENLLNNTNKT